MANQCWLEDVRRRLVKNGLPATYIRRFTEELSDHFLDMLEEDMSTEASVASRLGEANQVADTAADAYRRRTFLGRHPAAAFFVFAVSPIPALLGLFVLAFEGLCGLFEVYDRLGLDMHLARFPISSVVLPYVLSLVMVVLPCMAAAAFYCWLARKLGLSAKWVFLSCAALGIIAILPIWTVSLSDQVGQSVLRLGCAQLPQSMGQLADQTIWYFRQFRQVLQFLAPLAVGAWFVYRARRSRHAVEEETKLRLAA